MQIRQIRDLTSIKDSKVLEVAQNIEDNEILLLFGDGTYSKVKTDYSGNVYNNETNETVSCIRIDTNWRPLYVGIRLYNSEVRQHKRMYCSNINYITAFYSR